MVDDRAAVGLRWDMSHFASFSDELVKIAARRGLRLIRSLVSAGDTASLDRAQHLAQTRGVIKPSVAGSQVKPLGVGGEGAATLVATPAQGLSVRKLYDPEGLASPEIIRRKHEVGMKLTDASVAKYHGQAATPREGGTMQFSEYVPGPQPTSAAGIAQTKIDATKAIQQTGFSNPVDIRAGNMVQDVRTGKTRVIDYLPMHKDEINFSRNGQISPTPKGSTVFGRGRDFSLHPSLERQQAAHLHQRFLPRDRTAPIRTPAVTAQQNTAAAAATQPRPSKLPAAMPKLPAAMPSAQPTVKLQAMR